MDTAFQEIVTHIITDYGIAAFDNQARCKALLSDYARGAFKKEIRLLIQVLGAACHKNILESQELGITRKILVRDLQEDYYIARDAATDVIDFLIQLLRPQDMLQFLRVAVPEGFVRIQGGTFMMGSPASEVGRSEDETQHQVTISPFYLGKYEVTQREYEAVMGNNPSRFKGATLPVEQVRWLDAVAYCNTRSLKEGLTPVYTINGEEVSWNQNASGYRLPTEAEWECACRAGTTTPFNTGTNITTDQANYDGTKPYHNHKSGVYRKTTVPVGSFTPNSWGLYDMHGNVWEWCWDWSGKYSSGNQTDPVGASSGLGRVLRGGCWFDNGQNLRSASHSFGSPSKGGWDYSGFRLGRSSLL
ncbi:MAG: formylglycine-generating enzyme family protein [Treponema sp.]|jgi:formylglycine-generating enzyme required for sulfatase activity|nr:formylglycine-generating enzyme family protein [Treponema sp.]